MLKSFQCYDLYFSLMMGNVEMWCDGVNILLKNKNHNRAFIFVWGNPKHYAARANLNARPVTQTTLPKLCKLVGCLLVYTQPHAKVHFASCVTKI